jgi:hypothetical protein
VSGSGSAQVVSFLFNPEKRARRRLTALSGEVAKLRQRVPVLEEQVRFLTEVAESTKVDAVLSANGEAARGHHTAENDARRAARELSEVRAAIDARVAEQDRLLDRLLDQPGQVD